MTKKGFTLIELLVVIAIIGILSAVVLTSLNSSRQKANDTKKVSDVKQIALAYELARDQSTGAFDTATTALSSYISPWPDNVTVISNTGSTSSFCVYAELEAADAAADVFQANQDGARYVGTAPTTIAGCES